MDQLETLIYGFAMLIAYQCIDLPDKITYLDFSKMTHLGRTRLSRDAVAGDHSSDSQHGDGLRGTITQFLGPGQCIQ